MTEYRKYDTTAGYEAHNIRLTKDADVKDGANGQMVSITFVDSSRNDRDVDMWIEAQVSDFQAALGACLKKGDVLGVRGKLVMQKYGEPEKVALKLRRAELYVPIDLFMACKERGFEPGAAPSSGAGAGAGKPAAKGGAKPVAKKAALPAGKAAKKIVDMDDE
jgi:hypothetical protein